MKASIINHTRNYLKAFPCEAKNISHLINSISSDDDYVNRRNFKGHVTASGLVISHDSKVLVVFHKVLNKYLQPGGHLEDFDKSIIIAAKREVIEETNLKNLTLSQWCHDNESPILIDSHIIPFNKNKNEPEHFHHDFMYIFETNQNNVRLKEDEVTDYKWLELNIALRYKSSISNALIKYIAINND